MNTKNIPLLHSNRKINHFHNDKNCSEKYSDITNRISDVSNVQFSLNIATSNKGTSFLNTHESSASYISHTLSPQIIHHALLCGKADIILVVIETLRMKSLPLSKIEDLLAARNSDGVPGLSMALRGGHSDTIRVYEKLLKTSGLTRKKISELLLPNINNSTPGLFYALQEGYANAIRAYGDIVKYLNLPQEMAIKMLNANNGEGLSGLFFAAGKGNIEAMLAYFDIFKNINIDPIQIAEKMEGDQRLFYTSIISKLRTF